MFYLPLFFHFLLSSSSTILSFSFLNFFIPSSTISQFLFSLLNINFPPLPQFHYFPSSTSTSSFILYIFPSTIHRPPIDPTSIPHRPHINPTSTPHRSYIDPTLTLHRPQVTVDSKQRLEKHVNNIYKSASFFIKKISKIRSFLSQSDSERIVHAF